MYLPYVLAALFQNRVVDGPVVVSTSMSVAAGLRPQTSIKQTKKTPSLPLQRLRPIHARVRAILNGRGETRRREAGEGGEKKIGRVGPTRTAVSLLAPLGAAGASGTCTWPQLSYQPRYYGTYVHTHILSHYWVGWLRKGKRGGERAEAALH